MRARAGVGTRITPPADPTAGTTALAVYSTIQRDHAQLHSGVRAVISSFTLLQHAYI